ncbi:hypothetical protein [Hansschlegelia zhihuaiae]|uniref:Uncharacterized protein n=1 Tax=Hansschlegelia zhihuaiae TaxID=405005 RepID=A0A4V1KI26_9HYPH|nr:hypothetical protein [Hansschlegelia zhihuaiae]RXF69222.1 hypothetical protein EK403_18725 [Hansschlegelia zhihuaiae]
MKYLGTIRRNGALGVTALAGTLELECYEQNGGGMVIGSGEVEAHQSTIAMFKLKDNLDFVTDDGHKINLLLSDRKRLPSGTIAHITATGDLPSKKSGILGW